MHCLLIILKGILKGRHHYREPSRIPIKALKALKHCGFVDKEKQNNDGYTRSMEINKATLTHSTGCFSVVSILRIIVHINLKAKQVGCLEALYFGKDVVAVLTKQCGKSMIFHLIHLQCYNKINNGGIALPLQFMRFQSWFLL